MSNKATKLPDYAQAMLNPGIYPDCTARVELIQTQMSFVFLTDSYVYKTKKPVNLGYLDYTTLEKRSFFCEQELSLNRRLCPEAYIAVVAIVKKDNLFYLENDGEVIEYAVKMRRLPHARMMNVLWLSDRARSKVV